MYFTVSFIIFFSFEGANCHYWKSFLDETIANKLCSFTLNLFRNVLEPQNTRKLIHMLYHFNQTALGVGLGYIIVQKTVLHFCFYSCKYVETQHYISEQDVENGNGHLRRKKNFQNIKHLGYIKKQEMKLILIFQIKIFLKWCHQT